MINRALLSLGAPIPESAAMHDWWLAIVASAFGHIEALPQATIMYRQHAKNALGAQKFLSLAYFKKGVDRINKPEFSKQAHVNALLGRYAERLSHYQLEMLGAYKKLPRAKLFEKAFLIIKYGFFKMGFIRNVVNIFAKKQ